jgi:hypothetical protein
MSQRWCVWVYISGNWVKIATLEHIKPGWWSAKNLASHCAERGIPTCANERQILPEGRKPDSRSKCNLPLEERDE